MKKKDKNNVDEPIQETANNNENPSENKKKDDI